MLAALSACTAADSQSDPRASDVPTTVPTTTTTAPTTPTTPTAAAFTQPLALAYDIHRPALDLTTAQARAIVSGKPITWADLGQRGGPVRVRNGAAELSAAERDPQAIVVVPADALRPTVQVARVAGVDPLRDPSAYPLTTAADAAPPAVTTVTVTGDLMLGRRVGAATAAAGDLSAPLRPTRRWPSADLTIGNLESTLSDDGPPRQGDDSFAADPRRAAGAARWPASTCCRWPTTTPATSGRARFGPDGRRVRRRRLPAGRRRRRPGEAWRAGGRRAQRRALRLRRVRRDRRDAARAPPAGPACCGSGCSRAPGRCRGDLRRAHVDRSARSHDGWTSSWCCRTGARSTRTRTVRDQRRVGRGAGRRRRRPGRRRPPALGAGDGVGRGALVAHSLGNFVFDMDFSRQTQEGALLELVFWGERPQGRARWCPSSSARTSRRASRRARGRGDPRRGSGRPATRRSCISGTPTRAERQSAQPLPQHAADPVELRRADDLRAWSRGLWYPA